MWGHFERQIDLLPFDLRCYLLSPLFFGCKLPFVLLLEELPCTIKLSLVPFLCLLETHFLLSLHLSLGVEYVPEAIVDGLSVRRFVL